MAKFNPFKSCSCRACKAAPSVVKTDAKRTAHRKFRRQKPTMDSDGTDVISTGYKS